ncbi:MAG: PA14 domain-containing protein [Caldilineaceae bacterium]
MRPIAAATQAAAPAATVAAVPATDTTLQPFLRNLAATSPTEMVTVVIQQQNKATDLAAIVQDLGGQVTRPLPLINAFAATLPAGATVALARSPAVKWIALDAPLYRVSGAAGPNLRDEFNAISYSGSDGSLAWDAAWAELGETDGPLTGDVAIVSFLGGALQGARLQGAAKGLLRAAPLPAASTAFLNISYRRKDFAANTDWVAVEASSDGGATWATLGQLTGPASDAGLEFAGYPLADYAGSDLWVRFVTAPTMTDAARFYLDLVDIALPIPENSETPAAGAMPVAEETPADNPVPANSDVLTETTATTAARQIYLPLIAGDAAAVPNSTELLTATPDADTATETAGETTDGTVTAACALCINTANLLSLPPQTIGANQLWNSFPYLQGNGVTVAVVDSGIAPHVDFNNTTGQSRVLARVSFTTGGNTFLDDFYGHGTHVAGAIGANGAQSGGAYIGVAPRVNLVDVKVTNDFGAGTTAEVVAGLQWVHENRTRYNIRVVNLSLNSSVAESYHQSALSAALEILWFNGIVVVVSAGNSGLPTLYPPANDPFVITVGAADPRGTPDPADDSVASFSAYGIAENGSLKPDLLAPGRDIVSLLASDDSNLARAFIASVVNTVWGTRYFKMSGTSTASAVVAGAVALLLQDEPGLTPDQVKYRLMDTARPLAAGQCGSGAGRYLDIRAAVNGSSTASANTGVQASRMLWSGSQPVTWNSVSWNSVSWNSVSWNSVSWNSVSWNSVSWNSVSWNSNGDGGSTPCQAVGLAAAYYNNKSLSGDVALQRYEMIDADWGGGSPGPGVNFDNFSVRWRGQIEAPTTGGYQLQTLSDDGIRVWLNGRLVINNWSDHGVTADTSEWLNLTAGVKYDIVVEYYEFIGPASLKLLWKTPGAANFTIVPRERLSPPRPGLRATYFNNMNLSSAPVLDRQELVDFDWGNGGPGSSVNRDFFSARWRGEIEAPTSGLYQFQTLSDDGVRVWVNGQLLINNWTIHGPTTDTSGQIYLTAGARYSLVVEYFEWVGGATLKLLWKPPSATQFTPIPPEWLPAQTSAVWLGGGVVGTPSCVANNGRLDCFVRGTDNALHQQTWNGSSWSGWKRIGQTLTAAPSCTVAGARYDCFFRGSDNALWQIYSLDGNTWQGPFNLGGSLTEAPSCVVNNGRYDCFGRGTDNALYQQTWNGSRWLGWKRIGQTLTSAPNCTVNGARLDCFYRGSDNAQQQMLSGDGTTWAGPYHQGGALTGAPSCLANQERWDCFNRGMDNALYQMTWNGVLWSKRIWLGQQLTSAPTCLLQGMQLHCFFVGNDGGLWQARTPYLGTGNLAHGKPVSASSTVDAPWINWHAQFATDGLGVDSRSNGWSSNDNLAVNHTEWVMVDLGANYTINQVGLLPRNDAPNIGAAFPIDFVIQSSTDNVTWNTVIVRNGYPQPDGRVQRFSFGNTTARYVRITGTNLRPIPTEGNSYRMQFAEIQIFGQTPMGLIWGDPRVVPITAGQTGSVNLGWTSANVTTAQVWMSVDNGPEQLIAQSFDSRLSRTIEAGKSYRFTLYADTDRAIKLSSITVLGVLRGGGTIAIDRSTVQADSSGVGEALVSWATDSLASSELWLSVNGGAETLIGTGSTGTDVAPWLQPGQTFRFRLYTPNRQALLDEVVESTNVALGKPVTASSSVEAWGWGQQNATDGIDLNSNSAGWSSNSNLTVNHTEWVMVDLLSPVVINTVGLLPRQDGGNAGYAFPRDFTIAVSTDNVNWTTVINRTGYVLPATTLQTFTFTALPARYVRVTGTNLSTIPTENNVYRMQFAEIIVAAP